MVNINDLLILMVEKNASDLHLTVGAPPMLRIDGEIIPTSFERLSSDVCQRIIYSLLTDTQKERFEANNELDLSFGIKGIGRIRMNVFRQRGSVGAALRAIPSKISSFTELGLPAAIHEIVKLPKGLVLFTGPTGSGKTTTLATIIDYINEHRQAHIVTIEDPIEYIHIHKKSIINQREIGTDTNSFPAALKHILRQDPDVILVGEMRDLETISGAMTIAETGHLVFATLHTTDAPSAINRIIDVFTPHQQSQIRSQLSFVLQAVICQQLLLRAAGTGRVLAAEVMMVTPAVRNLIRDQKTEQIYLSMQTGGKFGMQTMNAALYELYIRKQITFQEALASTTDQDDLRRLCAKGDFQRI
ncbi:MAG: type IV pilus twitching motility protein PilT [Elusimicrobiota bacterium]